METCKTSRMEAFEAMRAAFVESGYETFFLLSSMLFKQTKYVQPAGSVVSQVGTASLSASS